MLGKYQTDTIGLILFQERAGHGGALMSDSGPGVVSGNNINSENDRFPKAYEMVFVHVYYNSVRRIQRPHNGGVLKSIVLFRSIGYIPLTFSLPTWVCCRYLQMV